MSHIIRYFYYTFCGWNRVAYGKLLVFAASKQVRECGGGETLCWTCQSRCHLMFAHRRWSPGGWRRRPASRRSPWAGLGAPSTPRSTRGSSRSSRQCRAAYSSGRSTCPRWATRWCRGPTPGSSPRATADPALGKLYKKLLMGDKQILLKLFLFGCLKSMNYNVKCNHFNFFY